MEPPPRRREPPPSPVSPSRFQRPQGRRRARPKTVWQVRPARGGPRSPTCAYFPPAPRLPGRRELAGTCMGRGWHGERCGSAPLVRSARPLAGHEGRDRVGPRPGPLGPWSSSSCSADQAPRASRRTTPDSKVLEVGRPGRRGPPAGFAPPGNPARPPARNRKPPRPMGGPASTPCIHWRALRPRLAREVQVTTSSEWPHRGPRPAQDRLRPRRPDGREHLPSAAGGVRPSLPEPAALFCLSPCSAADGPARPHEGPTGGSITLSARTAASAGQLAPPPHIKGDKIPLTSRARRRAGQSQTGPLRERGRFRVRLRSHHPPTGLTTPFNPQGGACPRAPTTRVDPFRTRPPTFRPPQATWGRGLTRRGRRGGFSGKIPRTRSGGGRSLAGFRVGSGERGSKRGGVPVSRSWCGTGFRLQQTSTHVPGSATPRRSPPFLGDDLDRGGGSTAPLR